jgi:putative Mn2+ efflux pump MntP
MPTDKKILTKGLKYLSGALPLFFIGPVVIHSSFKNQNHPFYIPVLGVGIILCIAAIVLVFLGLRTIMKSLTD